MPEMVSAVLPGLLKVKVTVGVLPVVWLPKEYEGEPLLAMAVVPCVTTSAGAGAGARVVKEVLTALDVSRPEKQLLTILTVYAVLGVKPVSVTGEPVAVCVVGAPVAGVTVTV